MLGKRPNVVQYVRSFLLSFAMNVPLENFLLTLQTLYLMYQNSIYNLYIDGASHLLRIDFSVFIFIEAQSSNLFY